ncbi:MAG: glycoside hydrolase family 97 protein [Bacteroidetes bacterium]|nr:MAG: glycoside hydrolase family 97 protein [Bacteroidota bacterium]
MFHAGKLVLTDNCKGSATTNFERTTVLLRFLSSAIGADRFNSATWRLKLHFMKVIFVAVVAWLGFCSAVNGQEFLVESPDRDIRVEVVVSANTVYRVYYKGNLIIHGKPLGMQLGKKNRLGEKEFNPKEKTRTVDRVVRPVVSYRSSTIKEHYNELSLDFESGLGVDFRCFDEGFGYRLRTSFDREVTITEEMMGFELTTDPEVWFPKETTFYSHNEREFVHTSSMELKNGERASMPVLWKRGNGTFIMFTETDLRDYPGMYLKTDGDGSYKAVHPKHPASYAKFFDRFQMPVFTQSYIARTEGSRTYPWRVFTIADNEKGLLDSHLPWLLASEKKLNDTEWIKPGKVAWDWWNALQLQGVDFKPGLNTQTYKYYIDFASKNGLQYIIMDEGWYHLGDLTKVKKEIDMPELIRYANEKNVKIILWVVWKTLEDQFDVAFTQFSEWGIAGIKMDFMMRSDQPMIAFYERVAQEAANRKMLVDFHGSHCPKGMQRTYPNVLTFEGVRGLEWNKWGSFLTPTHDVTLPFTRMLAGPMDYTPGAMENIGNPKKHRGSYKNPKSIGTRCHELAKYVVFESPLQMLADEPTAYEKEPECMKFLSAVPTVWDETVLLDAKIGEHVLMARRSGDTWFVGGMTGSMGQTISMDLSFLGSGQYEMELWRDGENTRSDGTQYEYFKENSIVSSMKYVISMAEGGGWVAIIRKS